MSFDISTNFGGLLLPSPVIVGSCPLTASMPNRIAMEAAGAGAVVLPSLFEEQVVAWKVNRGGRASDRERRLLELTNSATRRSLIPDAETYLSLVNRAAVQSSIPVIASLNGHTDGDWVDFAGELQEAGADAIEFCIHHRPHYQYNDPREIECEVLEFVRKIDESISVPLFMKLHREYTSLCHLARKLLSGTQGLILFARDPEIDITLDDCQIRTRWQLSSGGSLSPLIRSLMSVYGYCPAMPLAGSGGVGCSQDLIKVLLSGGNVAMVVSAVYREGPDVIRTMLDGLVKFMECNHLHSLNEMQSKRPLEFSSEEDRLNVIKGLLVCPSGSKLASSHAELHSDSYGHLQTEDRTSPSTN